MYVNNNQISGIQISDSALQMLQMVSYRNLVPLQQSLEMCVLMGGIFYEHPIFGLILEDWHDATDTYRVEGFVDFAEGWFASHCQEVD